MYTIKWVTGVIEASVSEFALAWIMAECGMYRVGLTLKTRNGNYAGSLEPHP
jgi:hypothetical protein